MKILYIGDIVARIGRKTVEAILPDLIKEKNIDFVIAQGENLTTGNGLTIGAVEQMSRAGVNFFTGGNHTFKKRDFYHHLDDPSVPVLRPANYPDTVPGKGWAIVKTSFGDVLIICVMGTTFCGPDLENPLKTIDQILEKNSKTKFRAVVVDLHSDLTSEKVALGHYLDGKATIVVSDHSHVPTADARILSNGTATITDVGMTGPYGEVLGVKKEIIIERWKSQLPQKHEIPTSGKCQFCSILVEVDSDSKAKSIEQIIRLVDIN